MKRLTKLLSCTLAIIMCFFTVGCDTFNGVIDKVSGIFGNEQEEKISVAFSEDLPQTVQIGTELPLRSYIEEDPDAVYILYVSYTNPNTGEKIENKKQSSMTFTFDLATVYGFKVEMKKGKSTATATATIESLPDAPTFLSVNKVRVQKGATKTFDEIAASANILITPSDLVDDIKFTAVEIKKAVFNNSETTIPTLTSSRDIADNETSFTFTDEGLYVFDISATNKSGSATNQLTVTTVVTITMY